MSKRKATAAEREYMGRVVELGCVICQMPCEYHHITTGIGMGQRAGHYDGFGLCPPHHRTGNYGVAIHAGKKKWEELYGSEMDWVTTVKNRLEL